MSATSAPSATHAPERRRSPAGRYLLGAGEGDGGDGRDAERSEHERRGKRQGGRDAKGEQQEPVPGRAHDVSKDARLHVAAPPVSRRDAGPSRATRRGGDSARARGGSRPSGPAADVLRSGSLHAQAQEHVLEIGPRLQPMPLRSRQDREQHRRTRTRLLAPQEQPVLPADGLIPQPSAPTRCCRSSAGRPPCTGTTPPLVPRVRHRLAQRRLGQHLRRQSIQLAPSRSRIGTDSAAAAPAAPRRPAPGPGPPRRIVAGSTPGSATLPPGDDDRASKNFRRACAQQATSRIRRRSPGRSRHSPLIGVGVEVSRVALQERRRAVALAAHR